MTTFILVCAAMLAAALLWLLIPLLRAPAAGRRERGIAGLALALLLPLLAGGMYLALSDWDWQEVQAARERMEQMQGLLVQLEAKLARNPTDVEGWLLLGKSSAAVGQYDRAEQAYRRVYELTQGANVEALVGLGEALVMNDEASLTGRAAELFEAALERAPNHPKALWYGSIAALRSGDLPRGRERLQRLLEQNPPAELAALLQRQIQDLDQQLASSGAEAAQGALEAGSAVRGADKLARSGRVLQVAVSLAPEIERQLHGALPLFILARDPAGEGPPLAVQRRASSELPLTVELSEQDAMIPSRSIASVPKVQIVARLSRSGAAQAQSGDYYGEASYEFDRSPGAESAGKSPTLHIIIDRIVP